MVDSYIPEGSPTVYIAFCAVMNAQWVLNFILHIASSGAYAKRIVSYCCSGPLLLLLNTIIVLFLGVFLYTAALEWGSRMTRVDECIGSLISVVLPSGEGENTQVDRGFPITAPILRIPNLAMLQIPSPLFLNLWRALNIGLSILVVLRKIRKTSHSFFLIKGEYYTGKPVLLTVPFSAASYSLTAVAVHCLVRTDSSPNRLRAFIYLFRHMRFYYTIAASSFIVLCLLYAIFIMRGRLAPRLYLQFFGLIVLTALVQIGTRTGDYPAANSDRITPKGMLDELTWTCAICTALALYLLDFMTSLWVWQIRGQPLHVNLGQHVDLKAFPNPPAMYSDAKEPHEYGQESSEKVPVYDPEWNAARTTVRARAASWPR